MICLGAGSPQFLDGLDTAQLQQHIWLLLQEGGSREGRTSVPDSSAITSLTALVWFIRNHLNVYSLCLGRFNRDALSSHKSAIYFNVGKY